MSQTDAIHLRSDALSLQILPRGAALCDVRLAKTADNLVLGFDNAQDHADIPIYAGSVVGPIANRVAGGVIPLGGATHQMAQNDLGRNCLHSGPSGLHSLIWEVQDQSQTHVTLAVTLADGAQSLPGNREINATYRVDGNTLHLTLTAQTDRATPMNIAAHPYWNLDASHDIAHHQLAVFANDYLPTNAENLPTGQIAQVHDTPFDFRKAAQVSRAADLDVNFCLSTAARPEPTPCATLTGAKGTTLRMATTAPGLQVYAGASLPQRPGVLTGGRDLGPYGGIALEPQCWPNAPHHAHFPQITLQPGEKWCQITTYQLIPAT